MEITDINKQDLPTSINQNSVNKSEIFVGKDILELISVSMYVDPLTIYREYIQNATDSLDDALGEEIYKDISFGEINVTISQSNRSIKITDNGRGISSRKFKRVMLSFGASQKRGTEARGFRGIGRFSGLGYCQKLIFRTKSAGEPIISEVEWDGRKLKRLLTDSSGQLSIFELVENVAKFTHHNHSSPLEHFFEVELRSVIRMSNDILLNEDAVRRYISQNCPVPYCSNFRFKDQLEAIYKQFQISQGYKIILNDDFNGSSQIYRPYQNSFQLSETIDDEISGLESMEFEGLDGGIVAVGWIYHHNYKGLIPSSSNVRGIRVRVGNTQIGDESLISETFPEPRFNSWSIGEIHVLNRKITPNGRRDDFDNSIHWLEIKNQFTRHAKNITKICRKNSAERNIIKHFNTEIQRVEQFKNALEAGFLTKKKQSDILYRIKGSFVKAEKLLKSKHLSDTSRVRLEATLAKYCDTSIVGKVNKSNDILDILPKAKVSTVSEVFDLIYECSQNKVVAQSLIEKILEEYKIRYTH